MSSTVASLDWASLLHHELRLACALVLQGNMEGFLALCGICCSTFVSISRGSTHRCEFLGEGSPVSMAVYKANKGLVRRGCCCCVGQKTFLKIGISIHYVKDFFHCQTLQVLTITSVDHSLWWRANIRAAQQFGAELPSPVPVRGGFAEAKRHRCPTWI